MNGAKALVRQENFIQAGLKIFQDSAAFCFGIDAVLLSFFAGKKVKNSSLVLDMGTGSGIIPLLLSRKNLSAKFCGLEIQHDAVLLAKKNVEENNLSERIEIIEGDLRNYKSLFEKQKFNVIVSNPPYMKINCGKLNESEKLLIARHELLCNIDDVVQAASYLIKDTGSFFLIHRCERLTDVFNSLKENNFIPKGLRFVVSHSNKAPVMFLMEARKFCKSELKIENNLVVYGEDNAYTDEVKKIYSELQ